MGGNGERRIVEDVANRITECDRMKWRKAAIEMLCDKRVLLKMKEKLL